ncbi:MAG TPA: MBL fold metallo-hydrolase [Propylenella sp.]|nr:MBL fold metallo-hydrolase [Propylenella sp.]
MSIAFNRDFEPRHGEAVSVAPGVRRVTARNPGPFTFHGTNTYLIGGDELAVLDPGPADQAHVDVLVHAIGGARVKHILVSHTHRDHSPAARLLQARTGAPILAAGPHRPARPLRGGQTGALDGGADVHFAPDVTLADGDGVEVSGCRLEAIATPGHTANHLAFALSGTDLLFSGDHVMGWATTIVAPPDGAMADYMASLERLLARPEPRYLPAHGAPISDAHSFVRALRAHRRMRERAIVERLQLGDRTIAEMVARIYSGLDPSLKGAAALSTLAHLEDLYARDLVASDAEPSLLGRYWLTADPGSLATGEPAATAG